MKLIGLAAVAACVAVGAVMSSTTTSALGPWTLDPRDPRVTMEDVEREVIRRYRVPDVTPATVAATLARGGMALFDVRTAAEFEAGHLPGAIRIEPGTPASEILRLHRDKLEEGPVVFYCAVGVRSSRLMLQTLRQLAPHAPNGSTIFVEAYSAGRPMADRWLKGPRSVRPTPSMTAGGSSSPGSSVSDGRTRPEFALASVQ